jgi:uncharacterized cupin superfamily protein
VTAVVNVFELEVEHDLDDPPGFQGGGERLGPRLGASLLGMTLYELPPGNRVCPYHYEYGVEEWLIVVSGRPTLRTPEGERVLDPGDVVCFPEGPEGAHSVGAAGDETVRVLMVSTKQSPDMAVYPDSDKIGAFAANEEDSKLFRRGDAVEYFDGEL